MGEIEGAEGFLRLLLLLLLLFCFSSKQDGRRAGVRVGAGVGEENHKDSFQFFKCGEPLVSTECKGKKRFVAFPGLTPCPCLCPCPCPCPVEHGDRHGQG